MLKNDYWQNLSIILAISNRWLITTLNLWSFVLLNSQLQALWWRILGQAVAGRRWWQVVIGVGCCFDGPSPYLWTQNFDCRLFSLVIRPGPYVTYCRTSGIRKSRHPVPSRSAASCRIGSSVNGTNLGAIHQWCFPLRSEKGSTFESDGNHEFEGWYTNKHPQSSHLQCWKITKAFFWVTLNHTHNSTDLSNAVSTWTLVFLSVFVGTIEPLGIDGQGEWNSWNHKRKRSCW